MRANASIQTLSVALELNIEGIGAQKETIHYTPININFAAVQNYKKNNIDRKIMDVEYYGGEVITITENYDYFHAKIMKYRMGELYKHLNMN